MSENIENIDLNQNHQNHQNNLNEQNHQNILVEKTAPKIYLVCLEGLQVFREVINNLLYTLRVLGYDVSISYGELKDDGINIVFCIHITTLSKIQEQGISAFNIIIYNLEQVGLGVQWMHAHYFEMLRHCHVWEYSEYNFEQLKNLGAADIQLVPISYSPIMRDLPEKEQDIDVLFYGTISPRRAACLDAIRAKGIHLVTSENGPLVGDERDDLIARSKIVLNMHYYEDAHIFEVVRVSHLLANSKVVVSELGAKTSIEPDIKAAIVHGSIQDLPELCVELLNDENRRKEIAIKGYEIIQKRDSLELIKQAMQHFFTQRAKKIAAFEALQTQKDVVFLNDLQPASALPKILQVGCRYWRYDCLNIDHRKQFNPDLLLNMGQHLPFEQDIPAWRFGQQTLPENYFDEITSDFGFEEMENLDIVMQNCMRLLKEDGVMKIKVHHEFAEGYARNPYAKKPFNETSFSYFTYGNRMKDLDWHDHIFKIENISYSVSDYGQEIMQEKNQFDFHVIKNIPRTIDMIHFTLRKVKSSKEDKMMAKQTAIFDTRFGD